MAYEVLLHLVYLLTSIDLFNLIQNKYIQEVKKSLKEFMGQIKVMLLKSSSYLYALMNKLIKLFCRLITSIFEKIKSKLLFYLKLVELQIYMDYALLSIDVEYMELLLSELDSEVKRYISILDKVDGMLKGLVRLIQDNKNFKEITKVIKDNKTIINKLDHKFSYQNVRISKTLKLLSSIKLERSLQSKGDNNVELIVNLKMSLDNLEKHSSDIINLKIDLSTIDKFNKSLDSIKNILDKADLEVSMGIMSIVKQLLKVETINLVKLYGLITQIQLKYEIILIRIQLLVCTIAFYDEIQPTINHLNESLKFECPDVRGFLSSCSQVENYLSNVSKSINACIEKLGESANRSKCLGVRKELLNLYSKIIKIIILLKFYVDLMAMEILIFKMIIMNLIWMAVSSLFIDSLMLYISRITNVQDAIDKLRECHTYLKTFYLIQLENSLMIFGLSSKLMFSQYIHGYYDVLIINLYWINMLIWVIECYINHLIVFKFTSVCLNSIFDDIAKQLQIITNIYKVISSLATISNKLKNIDKSITKLNDIQESMDITKWKESANKIRHETESISNDIEQINLQITEINKNLESIYASFLILKYLEYFILVLISYVNKEIQKTNKKYILGTGIGNDYYYGLIMNIVGPCNKQLKFILGYLVIMWANIVKLIKVVETTILIIIIKTGWLYGLTKSIQTSIGNINKGVLGVECAIDGVVINFIRCTLQSTSNSMVSVMNDNRENNLLDNQVMGMYSMINVMDYEVLVNRMLEFWTFSEESVELFKYIRFCQCALGFETKHRDQRPSAFLRNSLHSIKTSDVNPVSEFERQTMAENVGNHLCLCLVIKYHLRTTLLKCILYLRNEEFGTLDTLSRKYERYNKFGCGSLRWKLCGLVLNIIYELTSLLRNRYLICSCNETVCKCATNNKSGIRPSEGYNTSAEHTDYTVNELHRWFSFFLDLGYNLTYFLHKGIIPNIFRCFCMYSNDPDYHYIISTILFMSSLIENIWTMDPEAIRMAIEKLSVLYSQLEIYDFKSIEDSKKVCCNPVYWLLVNKDCEPKKKEKCCCCWCVTCYNLLMVCISLCLQFKLCNALCTKKKEVCEKVKEFCTVEDCTCTCQQKPESAVCCLLKLANDAQAESTKGGGCKTLQELLDDCSKTCNGGKGNGCCAKLKDKLKDGLCKLLLLGCECTCTTTDGELKIKCVFFNDLNGSPRVAVLVFCKCKTAAKECCLYQLIEKLKKKSLFDKICKDEECCCKELENVCKEICGTDCPPEYVCTKLKDKLESICKGSNGGCGNGECLCKLIKQTIGECVTKCTGGDTKCITKDGYCKCPCCKIVEHSLKIFTRACRQNVLEPYKRITIDIMCSSKDKQLILRIINGINQGTVNRLYLVKNNLITSNSHEFLNPLNTVKSRNWGYDTQHEHQPTHNSFSEGYPHKTNRSHDGRNKMFKLVLSRLLIAVLVILMFVYLRISYHQMIVIDSSLDNTDSVNENPKFFI